MEKEAKELFRAYVIHQGLCPHSLQQACYNAIPWLPGKSATDQTWVAWLQELHHTLEHMQEALKTMEKQQETLSTPGSALHEQLQHAQRSVRGLLSNTNCTLCLEGASPKPSPTPDRCEATSTFQQKLDGCSVLWNYSQFLAARARGSGRKARWANRDQQKRQKATKRKAATSRSFVRCPAKTGQP
ncbi:leukemia inhibitory factor-like isoform X3 [Carettochelys insculpta]